MPPSPPTAASEPPQCTGIDRHHLENPGGGAVESILNLLMKPLLLSLLVLLGAAASAAPEPSAPAPAAFPAYALGNTQLRPLPRSADGRDYLLHIALPPSHATSPGRRYPVVYQCDAYWGFVLINGLTSALVYDKVVPEFIIVGIGYAGDNLDYAKLRQWELAPVPLAEGADTGHADRFLAALEEQIIPLVEREYRGDPAQRVLTGSSLGGAFTLYTLFTKPKLFASYIAISPAVNLGRGWGFGCEAEFARGHQTLPARLFLSVGSCEWADFSADIRRFDQQLQTRAYQGLAYQFRIIEGERHGGTNAEALNRALRFVFEPLAPETGIQRN